MKSIVICPNTSPCKDCADRYLGCHSKCDKYKEFDRLNKVASAKRILNNQCRSIPNLKR